MLISQRQINALLEKYALTAKNTTESIMVAEFESRAGVAKWRKYNYNRNIWEEGEIELDEGKNYTLTFKFDVPRRRAFQVVAECGNDWRENVEFKNFKELDEFIAQRIKNDR